MDNILFFHPQNDFSGSTRVLANVIETEYIGRKISVITLNRSEGFLSMLSNVQIIPIRLLLLKGRKIPIVTSVAWRIYACWLSCWYGWNFDVFYINTILPYYAAVVGCLYRKQVIFHIHEKFLVRSLGIRCAEYVFRNVPAKHIFVSQYVKQKYSPLRGCEDIVKYNKLSPSFLSEIQFVPIEQRKRNTILMMSSLSKAKGLLTFIEVAQRMPHFSFCLVISANKESIVDFFDCDIPANVKLVSVQRNVHPFLRTSDLILNLSIPSLCIETFGMTILGAMAYGLPAIVPNVGGPAEVVIDGYNGYCIDVTNVALIIKTIGDMLDESEYRRLAENALIRLGNFV